MLRLCSLFLLAVLWPASLQAARVKWVHYPKVNPWSFDDDQVIHPNHANLPPDEIRKLIDADNGAFAPSERMILTALRIQNMPWQPELKAVVMRDCLDAITAMYGNWAALDAQYRNSVGFVGAVISDQRFLLLLSFRDGKFYRGDVRCGEMMEDGWQPDLENGTRWRPVLQR